MLIFVNYIALKIFYPKIMRFSAFSGKKIVRFSAKGAFLPQDYEIFGIFG